MDKREIIDILEKDNIEATDDICNMYEKLSKLNEDDLDMIDKLIDEKLKAQNEK
ncbi:TPA: hypothetical protein PTV74_003267 [Clostridium botulinum]|nr:hypothetical protein [Clostridium botulinum]HDK7206421.1 hypothetical protein [Clostridium botulinum]HDK7210157.1 hypothetical protein [Clostridium botulinum]HDK7265606.1 hypothetical protein [Clostridium botulinum]HDK7269454.1 hypothetical protein [Clostridium botulinum]